MIQFNLIAMKFQARGLLVFPFCTWAGTNTMGTSCTSLTQVETTVDGRQLALETTVLYVNFTSINKFQIL